ncbi:MAG: hypothetical protein ACFBSG_01080 [Leptolyngbyaceae cyanobacterium]
MSKTEAVRLLLIWSIRRWRPGANCGDCGQQRVFGFGAQYVLQEASEAGVLRSRQFAGLWLGPAALLGGDLAKVLSVLLQSRTPGMARLRA